MAHDHNTDACCAELSRVWAALQITRYNGKSASENAAELHRDLASARKENFLLRKLVGNILQNFAYDPSRNQYVCNVNAWYTQPYMQKTPAEWLSEELRKINNA